MGKRKTRKQAKGALTRRHAEAVGARMGRRIRTVGFGSAKAIADERRRGNGKPRLTNEQRIARTDAIRERTQEARRAAHSRT